jgi:hypothetical protein
LLQVEGQTAFVITSLNYDYIKMTFDDVRMLDFDLNLLEGRLKTSVESAMDFSCPSFAHLICFPRMRELKIWQISGDLPDPEEIKL